MITVISSSNSSSNNNDDERWRRPSLVSLLRLLLHVQGHRPSWSLERERETAAAGLKKKKFIIAAQSQSARTRPSGAAGRCKCKSASCWDNNSWPADWPPVWSAHGYWDDVCTFFNVVLRPFVHFCHQCIRPHSAKKGKNKKYITLFSLYMLPVSFRPNAVCAGLVSLLCTSSSRLLAAKITNKTNSCHPLSCHCHSCA